jgi:hypothetical protein
MGEKGVDLLPIPGLTIPGDTYGDPVGGGGPQGGGGMPGGLKLPDPPQMAPLGDSSSPAPVAPAPKPIDAVAIHLHAESFVKQMNEGTYPGARSDAINEASGILLDMGKLSLQMQADGIDPSGNSVMAADFAQVQQIQGGLMAGQYLPGK